MSVDAPAPIPKSPTEEPAPRTATPPVVPASEPDRCWESIGVRGDRSCPDLDEFMTCENCPAFTVAVVVFETRGRILALSADVVRLVTEARPMRAVPRRRARPLLGLVAVHDELLVAISLPAALGIEGESAEASPGGILVIDGGGERWAVPVDRLLGVHRVSPASLVATPGAAPVDESSEAALLGEDEPAAPDDGLPLRGRFTWGEREAGWLDAAKVLATLAVIDLAEPDPEDGGER